MPRRWSAILAKTPRTRRADQFRRNREGLGFCRPGLTARAAKCLGDRRPIAEDHNGSLYVGITDYDWFRFLSALPASRK
jgi:hypothetical protein